MTLSREDAERVLAEAVEHGATMYAEELADALRAMLEHHDLERRLVKQATQEQQRLIAQRDAAERERDGLIGHGCSGGDHNALALLDLYDERAREARSQRDAAEERGVRCGMAFAAGMADSLAETLRSANRRKAAAEVDTMLLALNAADPAVIIAAARERESVREEVGEVCPCEGPLDDPGPHVASCPYADPEHGNEPPDMGDEPYPTEQAEVREEGEG